MDLSGLAALGKVAGVGGIAVGVVAVLALAIIKSTSSLPTKQRAPMLRLVAMGAFGIGALGIVAWVVGGSQGGSVVASGGGVAAGRDITGTVTTGGGAPKPP